MVPFVKGAVFSFLMKHKINVRGSTEIELVGVDDALPMMLWCKYFIKAQGCTVEKNILYQDNKSAILTAKNGWISSSKRTKHIKARYFLVEDKIDNNKLEVKHRLTDAMWSGVFNKLKQGTPFWVFRGVLMNVSGHYDDYEEHKNKHLALFPQEGYDTVNAAVLNQIIGVLMNNKDEHIFHHSSLLEKSLFVDNHQLRKGTIRSLKACQQLSMGTIRIPKAHHQLSASMRESCTNTSVSHKSDLPLTLSTIWLSTGKLIIFTDKGGNT